MSMYGGRLQFHSKLEIIIFFINKKLVKMWEKKHLFTWYITHGFMSQDLATIKCFYTSTDHTTDKQK